MAKVYSTRLRGDHWTCQGPEGALLLLKDGNLGGLFFRLVTLTAGRVVWEHEVYFDFEYRLDAAFFHSFESDDGHQIGFLFASDREANDFAQVVYQKSEILQISSTTASRRGTISSPKNSREGSIKSVSSAEKLDGSKAGSRFLGLFRRKEHKDKDRDTDRDTDKGNNSKKNKKGLTADDIGDPTDFRHLAHIGFNQATGAFDVQNIPSEWKDIFQKAGITNAQLENKETAAFIANFVKKNVDPAGLSSGNASRGIATNNRAQPPPTPVKTIRGPPPPPPSRQSKPTVVSPPSLPSQPTRTKAPPQPVRRPPVEEQGEEQPSAPSSSLAMQTPMDPGRARLLASIRNASGGALKPVDRTNSANSPNESPSSGDQSDIMASMLAKALAERNRRIAHSDSEDDNAEW